MIESLAVAGYIALLLYGAWLFADAVANWFEERVKYD